MPLVQDSNDNTIMEVKPDSIASAPTDSCQTNEGKRVLRAIADTRQ
jgi:hypothetical protein